jgi:hypothetical protein
MDNRHRNLERWSQNLSIYRNLRSLLIATRSAIKRFPFREVTTRWATVLCYGALAAAGLALGWPWAVASLPEHLKSLGWGWWAAIPLGVVALISLSRAIPHLWRTRLGARSFWRYPPAWSAAPFGLALLLWFWALEPTARVAIPNFAPSDALALARWATYGTLACWLSFGMASSWWRRAKPVWRAPRSTEGCELVRDFSELRAWLSDDAPISVPGKDAFGHDRIAQRIATRVLSEPGATVAVLGALGSGKSSVAKLLEHELNAQGLAARTHLVCVSIWSYKTQEAAIVGILDALLDALSRHVSTLPLRGLPDSYLDLLEHAGDIPSKAARLLRTSTSPASLLAEFDAVARAIDRRFILWVEDDERFARTNAGSGPNEDPIGLVRSALFLLDKCTCVSVLLASGSSRERFDLEKVARYVEQLPQLELAAVGRVLDLFARGCFEGPSFVHIGRKLRDLIPSRISAEEDHYLEDLLLGEHPRGIARTLAELCTTPRVLKQALRSCLEKWEILRGEIDFEDLLAMCVLREAEPAAFDLVATHVDALRTSPRLSNEKPAQEFWSELDASYANKNARLEATRTLVTFVFERSNPVTKPQGIALSDHRDYWSRFMSVPHLTSDESDQTILRAAQDGDISEVAKWLSHPKSSRAAELLSVCAAPLDLLSLLEHVVEQRCAEEPDGWGEAIPGVMPTWRMMLHRNRSQAPPIDARQLQATLMRTVNSGLPHSIVLIDEITRYFTTLESEVESLLKDGNVDLGATIDARVHEMLPATFGGQSQKLAQALRGKRHDALFYVAWTRNRVRAKQMAGLPFVEWAKFSSTLLEAAATYPNIVLPQVARFVVNENRDDRRGTDEGYVYDAERAERFFGASEGLLKIFREHGPSATAHWSPLAAVMTAAAVAKLPEQTIPRLALGSN